MNVHKYDVFVSYAHRDDEALQKNARGWVRTLVETLKIKTDMLVRGEKSEFWMDPRLAGNRPFEPAILNGIDQAATLLVFLSVQYMDSYWCNREKSAFLDKLQHLPDSEGRIFVVEKTRLAEGQTLPPEFARLPRYQFWQEDPISKRDTPLGDPVPREEETLYWSELNRLAQDLARELNRRRASSANPGPDLPNPDHFPPEAPCVYLAEVTDDLRRKYHEVKSYLEQYGVLVIPKAPHDRRDHDAYQKAVLADLKDCKLFVQLLSGLAGDCSGEFPGFPVYQHQIAVACQSTQTLPILQWRAKELVVEDADSEAQKALLNQPSVRAEPIDDFKKAVREAALAKPQPLPPNKLVFVRASNCDWSLANQISDSLSNKGVDVFSMIPHDAPGLTQDQIEQDDQECLNQCDGLIVVYGGHSALTWARNQLLVNRKVLAQPNRPVVAVYVAPPPDKPELGVRFPGMLPLECRGNPIQPDESMLNLFVEKLKGHRP